MLRLATHFQFHLRMENSGYAFQTEGSPWAQTPPEHGQAGAPSCPLRPFSTEAACRVQHRWERGKERLFWGSLQRGDPCTRGQHLAVRREGRFFTGRSRQGQGEWGVGCEEPGQTRSGRVQARPAAPGALRRHCLLLGCRDLQEIEANILLPDWCGEQPAQHLGPGRV